MRCHWESPEDGSPGGSLQISLADGSQEAREEPAHTGVLLENNPPCPTSPERGLPWGKQTRQVHGLRASLGGGRPQSLGAWTQFLELHLSGLGPASCWSPPAAPQGQRLGQL